MKTERCRSCNAPLFGDEHTEKTGQASPQPSLSSLTISRATHNQDGDRIRIQVRVQGQILDFDMTPESFALAVTGLGEVPMSLERWRGRKEASPPSLRPVLQWFAERMEEKLTASDPKGGWEETPLPDLLHLLIDEVREVAEAKTFAETIYECADVANFAMMIADAARRRKK